MKPGGETWSAGGRETERRAQTDRDVGFLMTNGFPKIDFRHSDDVAGEAVSRRLNTGVFVRMMAGRTNVNNSWSAVV